jgi:hypothetical protein
MTAPMNPMNERLAELLVARALEGIDESEGAELSRLLAESGMVDDPTLEQAASAIQVAYTPLLRMPREVTLKIAESAERFIRAAPSAPSATAATIVSPPSFEVIEGGASESAAPAVTQQAVAEPIAPVIPLPAGPLAPKAAPAPRARRAWVPWLAAAACFLLGVFGWVRGGTRVGTGNDMATATKSVADMREALMKETGTVVLPWSATKDPAASGASGDLVWSEAQQKGFMRFHGLAANDKTREEYQLWIFDKQQDEHFPVDGGVFDVDPSSVSTGDVIVPIVAKIHVVEPTLFAVTVEKPGGVVVSKRERIVVTAAPKV